MYIKPFTSNFLVSSKFGMRNGELHDGVDFACPKGTPILAIDDGQVVIDQLDQYGGSWVDIRLKDGNIARYLHMSEIFVNYGQQVKKGQTIGRSGGVPGQWGAGKSTGAHLHLGLKINGKFVDPMPYLAEIKTPMTEKPIDTKNTPSIDQLKADTKVWNELRRLDPLLQGACEKPDQHYLGARIVGQAAELESWPKFALNRVLDANAGEGWKDKNLVGDLADLHQAVSRNDLLYFINEIKKLRAQLNNK